MTSAASVRSTVCAVKRSILATLLVLSAFAACGKKSGDQASSSSEDDPAVEYIAKSATSSIAEIKANIAKGDTSLLFKCAQMANIKDLEASAKYKALAAELTQLCTADVPLAIVRVGVEKAEAARKAKPDEKVLSECFSAEVQTGSDELKKAGKLDLAKELLARFKVACPDAK